VFGWVRNWTHARFAQDPETQRWEEGKSTLAKPQRDAKSTKHLVLFNFAISVFFCGCFFRRMAAKGRKVISSPLFDVSIPLIPLIPSDLFAIGYLLILGAALIKFFAIFAALRETKTTSGDGSTFRRRRGPWLAIPEKATHPKTPSSNEPDIPTQRKKTFAISRDSPQNVLVCGSKISVS